MALNTNIKVKLPDSKWVLSKPNSKGIRYVRYLISSERKTSTYVNVKRAIIGIYDEESNMLIPNNKYYELFGESYLTQYTPSLVRNYGSYYLLYRICSETGLLDTVKKVFPRNWDKIITIAMYNICEGDAMYYIDDYCDENFVINDTYVSSPETSKIFNHITNEDIQNFFKLWSNKRSENECIAYDITSISSYSKDISLLELGYNRDGENLPQINLGMFYGMTSKLPLMYDIYNGSIGDKTHFESMLKYAKSYDINNITLVMDRGFYKTENLEYLYKNQIPFVMGISLSIKEVQAKIIELKETITSSKYILNDELTYGISDNITINNKPYKLNLYYNKYKVADETSIIMNKINKLYNELSVGKMIESTAKDDKYFKLIVEKGIIKSFEKDYDKIDKALSYAGYYAILTSRIDENAQEVLINYRRKDRIEKTFDNLKNYIDCNRLRVHYDETAKGKIFVMFLSLIIKSVLDDKNGDMSNKKVMNEMKKIKLMKLANDEYYIPPLSKKQKDIISKYNIKEYEIKKSIHQLPL